MKNNGERIRRFLFMAALIIVAFACIVTVFLFFYQRNMIYFPKKYNGNEEEVLTRNATAISYQTDSGKQICFYVPPQNKVEDKFIRLWVLFGGNASLALDWMDFIGEIPASGNCAFLLVDYPGYGFCEGTPTRKGIIDNVNGAIAALQKKKGWENSGTEINLNIMGHSLGCAAALEFAVRHPVRRVVLLSPFTSLLDMARLRIHWPLYHILRDRFDNLARLDEIEKRNQLTRPIIDIYHGDEDNVVPFAMGEKLAASHPDITIFHALPHVSHESIMPAGENGLYEIIAGKEFIYEN